LELDLEEKAQIKKHKDAEKLGTPRWVLRWTTLKKMSENNKKNLEDNKKKSEKKDEDISIDKKKKQELESEETATVVVKGKKKKKQAPFLRGGRGQAHIKSSYNNTIVSVTDLNGAVLIWATAGKCGFKGPKKSTPYAAGTIIKSLANKIKELGIKEVDVFVKGVGTGRESAIRALGTINVSVVSIKDVTPIPHGGCRPKKKRRV